MLTASSLQYLPVAANPGRSVVQRRKFVIAIHDVSPKFADETEFLLRLIRSITCSRACAMLVVPDHWNEAPVIPGDKFARKLRDWAGEDVEMLLHGWSHRDEAAHQGWRDRFQARHFTAGEGEFLGLDRVEASKRLARGRELLETILDRPVTSFVAPAWLYGRGARDALAEGGFDLAEDHMRVWNPQSGRVLARGPVISWASRSRARIASSLLFANIAPVLLARQPVVRIALHPGDARIPALVRSIEQTIRHFTNNRELAHYADLS